MVQRCIFTCLCLLFLFLAGSYLLKILFWQDCSYVYLLLTTFSKFLAWKPFLLLLFNWSNSGNMGWLSTASRSILYLFFNVDHPCQCKVSVQLNLWNFPCWHLQFIFDSFWFYCLNLCLCLYCFQRCYLSTRIRERRNAK